ncbi:MAG: hypothetical protein ABFD15_09125 [Methanofastidiosum sp.]
MLTYLTPPNCRRGDPCLVAVEKVKFSFQKKYQYSLITFYNLSSLKSLGKKPPYDGEGNEYLGATSIYINKKLYDAFVAQSKANHKRYKNK